jgi:hypothetical protein
MLGSKIHIFLLTCVLLIGLSSSCEKQQQHPVPYAYVNFSINIQSDPEFIRLAATGNSMEISDYMVGVFTLGFDNNGVIIYNAGDNEYYVFDRTCPHDMPSSVAIESNPTTGLATCPDCGTEYVFPSMGTPTIDGPGIWPLREYKAYYNQNTGVLNVYN